MSSKLTNHDREMLEVFSDPAKFAETHLGEKPRWYQERILRHPHHRKVLRCGRRIGKCIGENERILNPSTGDYASVGELYTRYQSGESAGLATLDKHYKIQPSEAFEIEKNGEKPVFRVETKMGASVELTGNHPVLTLDGWVEVDALSVGMRIATPSALPYFGDGEMSTDRLRLIAYMITGGHWNGERMTFSCKSEERMLDFAKTAAALGIQTFKQTDRKNTRIVMSKLDTELRHAIIDKRIPREIFKLKPKQIARFLNFMYQISGWVHSSGRPELGISSTSKQLMVDAKHLLLRFGISANLQTRKKGPYTFYQMLIHRKSTSQDFLRIIGVFGDKATTEEFSRKMDALDSVEHSIPLEIWPHVEKLRKAKDMPKSKLAGGHDKRLKMDRAPGMTRVAHFAEMLQDEFLYDLAHSDVLWEEVVAIENAGMRETYDVFVPETHNLIVEDVMVHNTWTMTAHMLWVAFTCNGGTELDKGATCLVATPYDTQAREIFDQLNNFINNNPILRDSIERITRSPYEITFKNKSRIKLHTAGSKNGTEGGSMRGQKASWLYIDEVDYLGDKDFEAIFAITFEAPERIGVMVASTPTGRRGKFYQICHQPLNQNVKVSPKTHKFDVRTYDRHTAEGWQEFHYSTSVNPEWSERMEREMRSMYTEVGYEHEVLAEFGSEMAGVFNKDYIDEASGSGYALLSRPRIDAPIAIGIIWDIHLSVC